MQNIIKKWSTITQHRVTRYILYFVLMFIGTYFFIGNRNFSKSLEFAVLATLLGIIMELLQQLIQYLKQKKTK